MCRKLYLFQNFKFFSMYYDKYQRRTISKYELEIKIEHYKNKVSDICSKSNVEDKEKLNYYQNLLIN